eukprot:TRINITY_DN61621_c0_g1_i1.p1 TRINITY_DN61621_c0_g1~~TRINITY_DN61621_c0_g1_i1.p1  ORF type:complete len:1326 (+),score=108.39 TRINITY_DN61621_c0_g1_i1:413-3979(+)
MQRDRTAGFHSADEAVQSYRTLLNEGRQNTQSEEEYWAGVDAQREYMHQIKVQTAIINERLKEEARLKQEQDEHNKLTELLVKQQEAKIAAEKAGKDVTKERDVYAEQIESLFAAQGCSHAPTETAFSYGPPRPRSPSSSTRKGDHGSPPGTPPNEPIATPPADQLAIRRKQKAEVEAVRLQLQVEEAEQRQLEIQRAQKRAEIELARQAQAKLWWDQQQKEMQAITAHAKHIDKEAHDTMAYFRPDGESSPKAGGVDNIRYLEQVNNWQVMLNQQAKKQMTTTERNCTITDGTADGLLTSNRSPLEINSAQGYTNAILAAETQPTHPDNVLHPEPAPPPLMMHSAVVSASLPIHGSSTSSKTQDECSNPSNMPQWKYESHWRQEAALKVQCKFRVWKARRRVHAYKMARYIVQKRMLEDEDEKEQAWEEEARTAVKRRMNLPTESVVIYIQSWWRMIMTRRSYLQRIKANDDTTESTIKNFAATRIQSLFRGWQARCYVHLVKNPELMLEIQRETRILAAVRIQSCARRYFARTLLCEQQKAVQRIQRAFRSYISHQHKKKQTARRQRKYRRDQQEYAARMLQRVVGGYLLKILPVRRWLQQRHRAATVIQAGWRGALARKEYRRLFLIQEEKWLPTDEESYLAYKQSLLAPYLVVPLKEQMRNAAINIQAHWRGHVSRKIYLEIMRKRNDKPGAARLIQCAWRQKRARREVAEKRQARHDAWVAYEENRRNYAARVLQGFFKGPVMAKKERRERKAKRDEAFRRKNRNDAARDIQRIARGYLTRKKTNVLLAERRKVRGAACTVIQTAWRAHYARVYVEHLKEERQIRDTEQEWEELMEFSAVTIQERVWPTLEAQKIVLAKKLEKMYNEAAIKIQRSFRRAKNTPQEIQDEQKQLEQRADQIAVVKVEVAAKTIQCTWRRHKARKIAGDKAYEMQYNVAIAEMDFLNYNAAIIQNFFRALRAAKHPPSSSPTSSRSPLRSPQQITSPTGSQVGPLASVASLPPQQVAAMYSNPASRYSSAVTFKGAPSNSMRTSGTIRPPSSGWDPRRSAPGSLLSSPMTVKSEIAYLTPPDPHLAALRIQGFFRMGMEQERLNVLLHSRLAEVQAQQREDAALIVQVWWREHRAKMALKSLPPGLWEMAVGKPPFKRRWLPRKPSNPKSNLRPSDDSSGLSDHDWHSRSSTGSH